MNLRTVPTLTLLAGLAACGIAERAAPGEGATTAEVRAHCRSATGVQRAADLDPPGQLGGPEPPILPRANTRASDADYINCLRRYGVTP